MRTHGEPHWQPYLSHLPASTPNTIRNWLLDHGSLTKRLEQASSGDFNVVVISQGWSRPTLSESRRLCVNSRETVWVREVLLNCKKLPVVYARTVIPRPTLRGSLKCLSVLGTKPLGAALFKDPTLQRRLVDVGRFDTTQLPSEAVGENQPDLASNKSASIWGRRSLFTIKSRPLLVSEIFLNSINELSIDA